MPPNIFCAAAIADTLSIWDLADLTVAVGSIAGPGPPNYLNMSRRVVVREGYAYVCSQNDNALSIFNISTPAAQTPAGVIRVAGAPNFLSACNEAAFIGKNHICAIGQLDNSLVIINIANPAAPTYVTSLRGGGAPPWMSSPRAVCVSGNYAYVATAG